VIEPSVFRIEVSTAQADAENNRWLRTAHQLGFTALTGCISTRLFFVSGTLAQADAEQLARELLADPITERYVIGRATEQADHTLEITLQPGVTDPPAENLVQAAQRIGIAGIERAATGERYLLHGQLDAATLEALAVRVFSNPVVQRHSIDAPITAPFVETQAGDGLVESVSLLEADDDALLQISKQRRLSLDLNEMHAIRDYYRTEEREPTDVELETLAQTWSEHCVHKTFKATIDFTGADGQTETINGLLKTYIRGATEKINADWVRSAFVDNAGIVAFNDDYDLAFKVETHNHPSALEPFGGANTGVGGVVRDVLGVSARPIANTDVLCFSPEDIRDDELPAGVLHPRRVADGVIHGIEDYGNKMGIPTVNGAIFYDSGYISNPLVFCGCLGILPRGSHPTQPQAGDLIVVLGGRTGRDGLRGATFSSMEMDTATGAIASTSVQIGNPITEKQVQEVVLRARDEKLYNAITDCGAGGLSSAVGEMGAQIGARVQLQDVALKYPGLRPWEIWLSEAQERMVMAVPPENWERLQAIATGQDLEAIVIGTYEPSGRLQIHYGGRIVGDLAMAFLHDGLPARHLQAAWPAEASATTPTSAEVHDVKATLLRLLAHPNIRSKESVVRRYDHEVQGGTAVKPLVGAGEKGHGNSTVLVPLDTAPRQRESDTPVRGAALSVGICPQYGEIDPYAMAWAAVDEAFRNLVAVGADPGQVVLLDNFCWGNPNLPDRLGSLVLAAKGCHDAALAYNAPFVSGKDSLNNEYTDADGIRHAIPGTLLISALGIVPDVRKTITPDLKQVGNVLYVIGETRDEMGASHYNRVQGSTGGTVPQPQADAMQTMQAVHDAIQQGLIVSCHDVSEGGIAVALAEMCIASDLGAQVHHDRDNDNLWLFSESTTRFIVEVEPGQVAALESLLGSITHQRLGEVSSTPLLDLPSVSISLAELEQAWRGDLATAQPTPEQPPHPEPKFDTVQMHRPRNRQHPRVCILHANGTNRDRDAELAIELAGGVPEIVHVNQLKNGERRLLDYHMLLLPGGFSYGDDLGAGQLWAQDLRHGLRDDLERFVVEGRPVLGICNGFQALVKAGLLPDGDFSEGERRRVTLTYNQRDRFECRWVYLRPNPNSLSLFTQGLRGWLYVPVAHGEGRVVARDAETLDKLWATGEVALTYVDAEGNTTDYPGNPNGSDFCIAALTNGFGNILGLMPHPENHIFPWQHPRWHRGEHGMLGLALFRQGIKYA
jgi:phosphoribosylformylglycinamidine synthase II/phosphoribosylformylglycinamidine synthase I